MSHRLPVACLLTFGTVLLWSAVAPHDRLTWWLEVTPALVAVALLAATYGRFRLTNLVYGLITVHAIILAVGGHYTYELMPAFDWLKDSFHLARNYYDRLGHFAQGFVPAIVIRELLLRLTPLKTGGWLFALIVFSCLGISATYELIEWQAATALGSGADAFLATQGDVWDTQQDMAMAGIGALAALLFLGRIHDRGLCRLQG